MCHHDPRNDRRLALPSTNVFRYVSNEIAVMPEGVSEPFRLRTASEIQAERLARKRAEQAPAS